MCAPSVRTYDAGQAFEASPVHAALQDVEYLFKKSKDTGVQFCNHSLQPRRMFRPHDTYTSQSVTA
eukprot:8144625-Karenia_brevis.AAC.1